MNPKNTFLGSLKKSFIDPFLSMPKAGASANVAPSAPTVPGTGVPYRNDLQANNAYPTAPANNEAKNIKYTTPSSPAATSTKPTTISPPKTGSSLPPAGKQFVSNIATQNAPTVNGVPGAQNGAYGAVSAPTGSTASPGAGNATTEATKKPESPYLAFLRSMFDPEALKTSRDNLTQLNQRTADELLRTRKEEDRLRENKVGQLKTGQEYQLSEEARKSNRSLADLAIAKGVAQDVYDSMIEAGKSVFEAETAAKKAEQDQLNKDRDFGLDKDRLSFDREKEAQDKLEADRQFEEDKRQFGLDYALKKQETAARVAELNAKASEKKDSDSTKNTEALSSMNLVNTILESDKSALDRVFGSFSQYRPSLLLGDKGNLVKNKLDQIKGVLALENRQKLKGQGAVSDFEGKTLDRAASSLGRNLGTEDGVKQLKQIRGAIATSHGLSADVLIIDPVTKQSQIVLSDSKGIADAIADGLLVEYQ